MNRRNFLIILLLLLFATPCFAQRQEARMSPMIVGGGTPAAGGDVTAPTLTSATIGLNGTTLTLAFDENVTQGAGYNDADWDVDCTAANIAVTYVSGNGTGSHVYTLASAIGPLETCNIDFNGDANSEEDGSGNDLAAIVSAAVTNNSANYTADANCQAAWLFADNMNDSSGEGNTLTPNNGVDYQATYPTGHTTGKSIHLDGTNDNLSRTYTNLSTNFPGKATKANWSAAVWIYMDDNPTTIEYVLSKGYLAGGYLRIDTNRHIGCRFTESAGSGGSNFDWDQGTTVLAAATWYHIVLSFVGATSTMTLWVSTTAAFGDTINAETKVFTNVNDIAGGGDYPFRIGTDEYDAKYFDGYIYQPIIFDRSLSAAEAEEIYTTGITGAD